MTEEEQNWQPPYDEEYEEDGTLNKEKPDIFESIELNQNNSFSFFIEKAKTEGYNKALKDVKVGLIFTNVNMACSKCDKYHRIFVKGDICFLCFIEGLKKK